MTIATASRAAELPPRGVVRPLPGPGLAARAGDLLLVCADGGREVDDLLGLVAEVEAAGGDGGLLVRRVAAMLAADFDGRFPACAVTGPTTDGRLAVLVHGTATADLVTEDGDVSLAGADAITSVNRLISGPVRLIWLRLPSAGEPDPRSRLDSGVVVAGGLLWAVSTPRPTAPTSIVDGPAVAVDLVEELAVDLAVDPGLERRPVEPAHAVPPPRWPPLPAEEPTPPVPVLVEQPPAPAGPMVLPAGPIPVPAEVAVDESLLRQPDPAAPFVALLLIPGVDDAGPAAMDESSTIDMRPTVLGVLCVTGHFTNPTVPQCIVCGIRMDQQTLVMRERPRPPLGLLVLDDGMAVRLDVDYVVGREPQADPEVMSGTVRPLRITDVEGVVSRRHLRVALVGWDVQVMDLASANGTSVILAGDPQRHQLAPNQPLVIHPGAQITMGRRWLRFESYRSS